MSQIREDEPKYQAVSGRKVPYNLFIIHFWRNFAKNTRRKFSVITENSRWPTENFRNNWNCSKTFRKRFPLKIGIFVFPKIFGRILGKFSENCRDSIFSHQMLRHANFLRLKLTGSVFTKILLLKFLAVSFFAKYRLIFGRKFWVFGKKIGYLAKSG